RPLGGGLHPGGRRRSLGAPVLDGARARGGDGLCPDRSTGRGPGRRARRRGTLSRGHPGRAEPDLAAHARQHLRQSTDRNGREDASLPVATVPDRGGVEMGKFERKIVLILVATAIVPI